MLKNALKTCKYIGMASAAAAGFATIAIAPQSAYAANGRWDPHEMAGTIETGTGVKVNEINQDTVSNWVLVIANWIIGIFVCIFVLKLVFTAIAYALVGDGDGTNRDRSGAGRNGVSANPTDDFILYNLGFLSAYPGKPKEAIIHKFLPNLAICLGAWLIVQIGMSFILWFFDSAVTNVSGA